MSPASCYRAAWVPSCATALGRSTARTGCQVTLVHYLDVLRFEPGSAALAQARAAGVFTSAHRGFLGGLLESRRRRGRHPRTGRGVPPQPTNERLAYLRAVSPLLGDAAQLTR